MSESADALEKHTGNGREAHGEASSRIRASSAMDLPPPPPSETVPPPQPTAPNAESAAKLGHEPSIASNTPEDKDLQGSIR